MRRYILLCLSLLAVMTSYGDPLPKIQNVVVKDLYGDPAVIPHWGEKYLLIFYLDPDRASMNIDWTNELEENKRAESPNIFGMGVINLRDAPFVPNSLARVMARKRTEKNGATVLSDEGRILATEWGLGDCNNQFVVIVITPDEELLFVRKGVLSEDDKVAFLEVMDQIKAEVEPAE